jgi:hypothetical protein
MCWVARGSDGVGRRVITLGVAVGDDADLHALSHSLGVDLVVHVRDVARIDDVGLAIGVAQEAEQHIEGDDRAGVADMDVVVDGGSADIHRHPGRIGRSERPLLAAHSVVQDQVH